MDDTKYFVHPSSYIDDNVRVDVGTKIWHFCHVQTGASIGRNCTLGQNVYVGNNVKIGNGVHIQNNVSLSPAATLPIRIAKWSVIFSRNWQKIISSNLSVKNGLRKILLRNTRKISSYNSKNK